MKKPNITITINCGYCGTELNVNDDGIAKCDCGGKFDGEYFMRDGEPKLKYSPGSGTRMTKRPGKPWEYEAI